MTAFFRRRQVKWWRLLIGSLVGTTYVFILFVDALSPLYSWYGKLGLSILMMITTFGLRRMDLLFKDTLIFYVVSFLFGGGIFAFSFLLQGQESTLNGLLVFEDSYVFPKASLFTLAIGYVLMFIVSKLYFQAIEVGKRKENYVLSYRLSILGECVEGKGLLDTGNGLHEPITRIPVIILHIDVLASLIPSSLIDLIKRGDDAFLYTNRFVELPIEWQSRLRVIPYRGVGNGTQMLIAIVPDWIEIVDDSKVYRTKRIRVGLKVDRLTSDDTYNAILHPAILQDEVNINETYEEVHHAENTTP